MAKMPVLKPREVVRLLSKHGFVEVRQRGSHKQFRHSEGRVTTVPFHKGRDVSPALLRQITRDVEMTPEEFLGIGETTGAVGDDLPETDGGTDSGS